jgi:hypothetical protein
MEGLKWELDEDQYIEHNVKQFQDEQDDAAAAEEPFDDRSPSRSQDLLQALIDTPSGDDQVMGSSPCWVMDVTADAQVHIPHPVGSMSAHSLRFS